VLVTVANPQRKIWLLLDCDDSAPATVHVD
jgi:hypothetical protein